MTAVSVSSVESTLGELTERSYQLDLLRQRVADLLDSPSDLDRPVIVLTGAAGAGKTSLVRAATRLATESGIRFLGASASRAERTVPLEVVRQLVRAASPSGGAGERVWRLLDEAALTTTDLDDPDHETTARTTAAIGGALLEIAAAGPVVIAVDDVHHADVASLRCLGYLARRLAGLAVLIVLTEAPRTRPWHPEVYANLLQPARLHRIRLPLLSPEGTYRVLAARLGVPVARGIAAECHEISGGNPLLVLALADDHLAAAPRAADRPIAGEAFREGVLGCLYRCEHLVLEAARVLAVTGEPLRGGLLPHLVDAHAGASLGAIDESTSAGLIVESGLRHPAVRRAVLDGMTAEEHVRLNRQAACLLYADGSLPARIAPYLVGIDELGETWMAQTLLEAGEQALLEHDLETALRYLRRANRDCADEVLRARIQAALARAEWRLDPQAALPHLLAVASALRAGHLDGRQATGLIQRLLWHGHVDTAVDLVHQLAERVDDADPRSAAELVISKGWISTLYPGVTVDRPRKPVSRDPLILADIKRRLHGASMLASVLEHGDASAVEEADRTLATIGLADERDMWTAICALITIIFADRLELAGQWCVRLSGGAAAHPTPAAMLAAFEAAIADRRGDLPRARALAGGALTQLSPKGWGVLIGIPLAIQLRALTFMDDLDAAASCLRVPVPPVLFETPFGLHYLHARGLHALAIGSPESALADFQLCGQLMAAWQLDLPALVPWRTESARALLWMGRRQQAKRLVREDLRRLRPGHVRRRGAALRVLAAAGEGPDRIQHLRNAVRLLRQCGDRMELAHSLTDLAHAYQDVGELRQARSASRDARRLAGACGISLRPSTATARGTGGSVEAAAVVAGLTEAESQVAVRAAQGYTNREIAKQLFLAVSTIEQRLTHIYRKLDVNSRRELSARLRSIPAGATPTVSLDLPRHRS